MTYAIDSNIIIHLLRGTESVRKHRDNANNQGARFIIPPFVNYEIMRGFLCVSAPAKEAAYRRLCAYCSIGEMTVGAWERAAQIYAELYTKHFTVKDADIVIAAFCMVNDYSLVTDNTKDFENIDGLQFVNWVE